MTDLIFTDDSLMEDSALPSPSKSVQTSKKVPKQQTKPNLFYYQRVQDDCYQCNICQQHLSLVSTYFIDNLRILQRSCLKYRILYRSHFIRVILGSANSTQFLVLSGVLKREKTHI